MPKQALNARSSFKIDLFDHPSEDSGRMRTLRNRSSIQTMNIDTCNCCWLLLSTFGLVQGLQPCSLLKWNIEFLPNMDFVATWRHSSCSTCSCMSPLHTNFYLDFGFGFWALLLWTCAQERPSEGSCCYSVYLYIKTYKQSLIEHHRQMNDKSIQLCCIFW